MQPSWIALFLMTSVWTLSFTETSRAQSVSDGEKVVAPEDAVYVDEERFFEQHVRPLLIAECIVCHGAKKQEGGLRLDSRAKMLEGGESGPAIVPGDIASSRIVEAVNYAGLEMPPQNQLSQAQIAIFERWIQRGAVWPNSTRLLRESDKKNIDDTDRQWWAFQPLATVSLPVSESDRWSQTAIDRWIYARLQEQGMEPAPPAVPTTLARRIYFDLIGLPPTRRELDEFLLDDPERRVEHLIDRLLDDPRYGEHWARYWLDLVRYAESDGWKKDDFRPQLYRYRDYVVHSFNSDRPYAEFVLHQLAGDELDHDDPDVLAATGYLRLGIYEYNQRNARSHWNDILNEITDVTADVFLGLGLACARCHDHKFDPLTQRDYFQLRAFFEPLIWKDNQPYATARVKSDYDERRQKWEEATAQIRAEIAQVERPYRDRKLQATIDKFPLDIQACIRKPEAERTSWDEQMVYLIQRQVHEEGNDPLKEMKPADKERWESLQQQLTQSDDLRPAPLPELMSVGNSRATLIPTTVPGDAMATSIPPGFPEVLARRIGNGHGLTLESSSHGDLPMLADGTRRTALARWIGHPQNPLTTRVFVNRIWQYHFGRGLVGTSNDFGTLGDRPAHPELLDWLATELLRTGGKIKPIHKQILMSAAWQQSAHHPQAEAYAKRDPLEQGIWRSQIRRLNAEQIRDALLAISGDLKNQLGGPSVTAQERRRSLYVKSFRNTPEEFLQLFDSANGLRSVAERDRTTTPLQALMMLNGSFALDRAKSMALRLQELQPSTPSDLISQAIAFAWGRTPTSEELAISLDFFGLSSATTTPAQSLTLEQLTDFSHVLINANEFIYVD